ncbi:hypothetical protein CAEBREN_02116 [Caenorhabditis brenneri]|uniref:Uncharacterized protein n=1 Tax=Caenorhabditis brenneri TaxID=135651 RepID=G0P2N1_CAEBE|nr:hypothetical protein CAEBREN_02116 [Caenorhabditis brenneri]
MSTSKVVRIEKETNAYVRLVFSPKVEKAIANGTMTEEDRRTATKLHYQLYQVVNLENNHIGKSKQPKVWFNKTIRDETVESLKDFINENK